MKIEFKGNLKTVYEMMMNREMKYCDITQAEFLNRMKKKERNKMRMFRVPSLEANHVTRCSGKRTVCKSYSRCSGYPDVLENGCSVNKNLVDVWENRKFREREHKRKERAKRMFRN